MRWLGYWAVVIAGSAAAFVPGCLTSQDTPAADDGSGVEDPPISTGGRSGSGGSSQGGGAGEPNGGTGDRGGSAGTTSSGDGGADGGCTDDRDCAFRPDDRSFCSVPSGECVDCLTTADCGANEECIDNDCRPFTVCTSTSNCPAGLVCNTATDRCVECLTTADCAGSGGVCQGNVCRSPCTANSQCAPLGMVCNGGTSGGYCVDCVGNADCPADRNCQGGTCVRDICVGGQASCQGVLIATCDPSGAAQGSPVSCGTQMSCLQERSGARCAPWICDPGQTGCSRTSERVVTCSADGLSEEEIVEDCAAMNMLCVGTIGGTCQDVVCEPNLLFCQGNTVQLCNATGTGSTLNQTCTTSQFCQESMSTASCVNLLCAPNMPACDMNVATTCNATGTGYMGARTNCSATMQVCSSGTCITGMVDLIPQTPMLYGSPLGPFTMLNVYSVSTSRTLTQIEQYMNHSSAQPLTWHVYESTTQTGTYTNILSGVMTTSTTGPSYQSSGAISVPLVAGRFYAIGLAWTTATDFGYHAATASQATSFGSLVGSYVVGSAPPAATINFSGSSSAFLPQRLTTGP